MTVFLQIARIVIGIILLFAGRSDGFLKQWIANREARVEERKRRRDERRRKP